MPISNRAVKLENPGTPAADRDRIQWGREYLRAVWEGREPPPPPPERVILPLEAKAAETLQARRIQWARRYLRAVFEGREPPPPPG
jgi:hypothetical protein